jgi:L-rhamnose-H+ transport protein
MAFGLTMRYLGMALGMAVALGFCAVFGTLAPPLVERRLDDLIRTSSGITIASGIATCLVGIGICGLAGIRRDRELTKSQEANVVGEFALLKGFALATIAGILSACFAFGLAAGSPITETAISCGTKDLYSNNAVLVVILSGGLTTNLIWCLGLNIRNCTYTDYMRGTVRGQVFNYAMAALGGVIWYLQFFFYGMGTTKLGETYGFSSWSLHMAFIIVFSNMWGLYFREWRGTSSWTKTMVWIGILTLILSATIIGYGNYSAGD